MQRGWFTAKDLACEQARKAALEKIWAQGDPLAVAIRLDEFIRS